MGGWEGGRVRWVGGEREEMKGWEGGRVRWVGRVDRFGLRGEWARRRESGGGEELGEIGRVKDALGRGKKRCLERRGMVTATGVSREATGWGRAPPQGLRGIEVNGVDEEARADREQMGWDRWCWKGLLWLP